MAVCNVISAGLCVNCEATEHILQSNRYCKNLCNNVVCILVGLSDCVNSSITITLIEHHDFRYHDYNQIKNDSINNK